MKGFNFKNAFKELFRLFTIPIAIYGIVDILYMNEKIQETWINILGINTEKGMYYSLFIIKDTTYGEYILQLIYAFFIIVILAQIILFIKSNVQEKLLVIEHNSINIVNYKLDKSITKRYKIKEYRINQYSTFNLETPLLETVNATISEIKYHSAKLRNKLSKYMIAYAGIANIPSTFMLGYELGDENRKKYLHLYRGSKTAENLKDDKFHLLEEDTDRFEFNIETLAHSDKSKKGKILLLIQLTQPITQDDYNNILEPNDHIIFCSVSGINNDYDIVYSSTQIEKYTEKILTSIADIQKNPNIIQVKVCIAASGAFVFALGTKFSKTQNIETVVYHYQNNVYSWGINITNQTPVIANNNK